MPDKEIDAIVLRFRDKGENVVNTIKEHTDKINSSLGYVWWGWWAKDHEFSPLDYFKIIENRIKEADPGFSIFLLHTKTKKLYLAECDKIMYSEDARPSPDPEATPKYYSKVSAKLWLKFRSIKETDSNLLLNNVYSFQQDSKTFFSTKREKNHIIAAFAGYKLSSFDVFTLQDRTIWFLRKQRRNDREIDINEWLPPPDNFAKHHTHARKGAYKLLVLSDLHFTYIDKHNFRLNSASNFDKLSLIESLDIAINGSDSCIGGYDKIAGIIIAGDFVFRPIAEEFELAKSFVKDLLEKTGLKPEQLAIVPGNHDVAFSESTIPDAGDDIPEEVTPEAAKLYRDFYENIYNTSPNKFLCGSRKIKLSNDLQVEVICVNSCVLQQEKDHFVQGYVGDGQWEEIKTQLNLQPDVKTYSYRILLLHHHLMSTSIYSEKVQKNKNYNILLDAGSVSHNVRKYNIKLVIHGHGHESGYDHSAPRKVESNGRIFAPNSYDVISMGSAGSSDLPSGEKNTFGILDFSTFGKVKFEKYELPTTHREKDKGKVGQPIECWEMPVLE